MSNSKYIKPKPNNDKAKGLKTYMLKVNPTQKTIDELIQYMKELGEEISDHPQRLFSVFKTVLGEKTFYICWSSGKRDIDGNIALTMLGLATLEALMLYPEGSNDSLAFAELKITSMPLQELIIRLLSQSPTNSKICFWGDIAKDLDGKLFKAFNVLHFDGTPLVSLEELRKNSIYN